MKIQFNQPSISGNELNYISDAIKKGHISGDGFYTKACHSWFKKNYKTRKEAAVDAQEIVNNRVQEYMNWRKSQSAFSIIKLYRDDCEDIRKACLNKSLNQLKLGKNLPEIHRLAGRSPHQRKNGAPCARGRSLCRPPGGQFPGKWPASEFVFPR